MLHEEQVVELLRRCEGVVGRTLPEVRGKLKKPDNRAAAAWELLAIDSLSELGKVEYEAQGEGSPDLLLTPPTGRPLWVEIAYLYPDLVGGRRPSPRTVREHVLHRVLSKKAGQHDMDGPYVVCVGSFQHSALFDSGYGIRTQDAVGAAFNRSSRLSAAVVVNIQAESRIPHPLELRARSAVYLNADEKARYPLTQPEADRLSRASFNRWTYTFSELRKSEPHHRQRSKMIGPLRVEVTPMQTTFEVAVPLLVEALAGKTTLRESYGLTGESVDAAAIRAIEEGWSVVDCVLLPADAPNGKPRRLRLTLSQDEAVFRRGR